MISDNEREFILSAIKAEQRVDGRRRFDFRRIHLAFCKDDGSVEVQLGQTRVLAVVSAELSAPYPDRPNEGSLAIFTEFSPMADPGFEPGRPGEAAVELGRIVDRGLRESRALDTEALCVVAGRSVWALRVDCHVLDNGGNLVDAANLAALAGLLAFRRPEVTVGGDDGQEVTVHPPEERDPLPLAIHHLPIAITFAFFNDGEDVVVDPSLKEEAAMGGRLTLTLNVHGEICAVQKGGGVPVRTAEILRCMRIARNKAKDLTAVIRQGVEAHERQRQERKVKRHPVPPSWGGALQGREVVLRDRDLATDQNRTDAEGEGEGDTGPESTVAAGGDREGGEGAREMEDGEHAGEEEEEHMEEEEEESDAEEEEEEEEVKERGTPRANGMEVDGRGGTRVKKEPFTGSTSSWLEEDSKPGSNRGRARGKLLDAEAMDEFEQVAAMLSNSAAALPQTSGSVAAAAVYASRGSRVGGDHWGEGRELGPVAPQRMAVDSDEEEATVELKGEFAASRKQKKPKVVAQEEEETLAAAVKVRKVKKKRPGAKA